MSDYTDEIYGETIADLLWLVRRCGSTDAGDAHPAGWWWTSL